MPDGGNQALSHALELALIHEGYDGTANWASVVVPFIVSSDPAGDILSSLTTGANLPTGRGQVRPVMVSSSVALDLPAVFRNASFLQYWAQLPTACSGDEAYTANAG